MAQSRRWTSADLERLPDDGKRYEIIAGALYVSKQPSMSHQFVCGDAFAALREWSRRTGMGAAVMAPGVIFADDDDVAPDIAWISHATLAETIGRAGHIHGAPELIVEVLSPGRSNELRDREAKRSLYSRRGVKEYWIVDWQRRQVELYRWDHLALHLEATLMETDAIESPLLPGFRLPVADLFVGLLAAE
jgi:Uma2 family endonuclease